jgi:hypothetical protein
MARGGAMTSDSKNYEAIFVNPALLKNLERKSFRIEFQIEGSDKMQNLLNNFLGYDPFGAIHSEEDLESFENDAPKSKLAFLFSYLEPEWAISFIWSGELSPTFTENPLTDTNMYFGSDFILQYTFARTLIDNLNLGFNTKIIYRGSSSGVMDYSYLYEQGVFPDYKFREEGFAFAVDLGSQYIWHKEKYDITVGLAVLDIGTGFILNPSLLSVGNIKPYNLTSRVSAGGGFTYNNLYKGIKLNTNLDFVKALLKNESSVLDLINWGINIQFPKLLSISTGLYQGYLTAGMELAFWYFNFSFATYAENTMSYFGERKKSDRRYTLQLAFII